MEKRSSRVVQIYALPLAGDIAILRPEQVILEFPHGATSDIGAACYMQRDAADMSRRTTRKPNEGHKVSHSSLCPTRVGQVRSFINFVSNEINFGKRNSTTIQKLVEKILLFLKWADENGFPDALSGESSARRAAKEYSEHIRGRVQCNEISNNTGARLQKETVSFLEEFLNSDTLRIGIRFLRRDANDIEATAPPSEEDQGRVLRLCEVLFEGLSTLVLESRPYPYAIRMPSYLEYPDDTMWIFPVNIWCLPVSSLLDGESTGSNRFFDYSTGGVISSEAENLPAQVAEQGFYNKSPRRKEMRARATARKIIRDANLDPNHWNRRQLGMIAVNCFLRLFLSRVAINWEGATSLTWDGDFKSSVKAHRQKFRDIKFRAGGKVANYALPLAFMPTFKRYLELRSYMLKGLGGFDGLFFTLGANCTSKPDFIRTSLAITYRSLQRIDPELKPILSRKWRAAMTDWLPRETDVETASRVVQNSPDTFRRSYMAGSQDSHYSEMTALLTKMIVDKDELPVTSEENAVGKCTSFGNASPIFAIKQDVAHPTCDSPETGCLFCEKFRIHADETDVRKLLSCRYCLIRTSHLAGFHNRSEPIIRQIDGILDEVTKHHPSLVERIWNEVMQGELDPYWVNKYDMLLRLNLVNDND